jgi:hypothetical protein
VVTQQLRQSTQEIINIIIIINQGSDIPTFSCDNLYVAVNVINVINKHRGPGFDSRALLRIFLRELGLERGPLSLVIG